MKVKIPIEVNIPDKVIQDIIADTQKQMADEVCAYIEEQRKTFEDAGTDQAKFAMFGMGLIERKLEAYK